MGLAVPSGRPYAMLHNQAPPNCDKVTSLLRYKSALWQLYTDDTVLVENEGMLQRTYQYDEFDECVRGES